jgi:predicted nucleic acid-binding protein
VSRFFDSNILVYAMVSNDPRRPAAEALLAGPGHMSAQVLNEFVNVMARKLKRTWSDIEAAVLLLRAREEGVRPVSDATTSAAIGIARDAKIHFYDALIVASALECGCDTLMSEDMQHGRKFGRLQIQNPFLGL